MGTAVALATLVLFATVVLEQIQPGELVAMLVIGGPFVQKSVEVGAGTEVLGLSFSGKNWALTSTGITAPVLKENSLCPSTRKRLRISPLCDVIESHVFSSLENTSSRTRFDRASWPPEVSARMPDQSSSSSVKPGSIT